MLHAAVLDDRIRNVTLERMLASYASVVEWKIHQEDIECIVPGALASYDLPDLAARLAPRGVKIINATNPRRQVMELGDVKKIYVAAERAFAAAGASAAFSITRKGI